jgi:carbon-monoxide dehydrogenase medium subunit
VIAKGPNGEREIAAGDLFTGFLETALAPDEMMTEIRIPNSANAGWSYQKFNRRAQDWAIVAVAAVVPKNNGSARVALVNMGSTPMTSAAVEGALANGAGIDDAAAVAADGTSPPEDLNGDAEYRAHLARVLTKRALTEAS